MLIQVDAKSLEWCTCVHLSGDSVALEELVNDFDMHSDNQARFQLPDRRIAKIFLFRLIYGGSKWAYAFDPDFNWISTDAEWWQEKIDIFYDKYYGVARWHKEIMEFVERNGYLRLPTGRIYSFKIEPHYTNEGILIDYRWPRTKILNYPVSGLAEELMVLARISAFKRLKNQPKVLFINTVHDNIVLDVDNDPSIIYNTCLTLHSVMLDIPRNFKRVYGSNIDVPIKGEVEYGHDWYNMTQFKIGEPINVNRSFGGIQA